MSTTRATGTASGHWHAQAACRGANPELFFPISDPVVGQLQEAMALQLCAVCPVRPQCLLWALDHHQISGVWGGTTEGERSSDISAPVTAPAWRSPGGPVA